MCLERMGFFLFFFVFFFFNAISGAEARRGEGWGFSHAVNVYTNTERPAYHH